jgi:hypothetical protein
MVKLSNSLCSFSFIGSQICCSILFFATDSGRRMAENERVGSQWDFDSGDESDDREGQL